MTKQTVLVTGGTRGIGLAITKALRDEGHPVAAIYYGNEEAAQKCAQDTGANVYKTDVCDFDACQKMVMMAEDDLGPIGIVVNNAGFIKCRKRIGMTYCALICIPVSICAVLSCRVCAKENLDVL